MNTLEAAEDALIEISRWQREAMTRAKPKPVYPIWKPIQGEKE